ncbi:MAG: transposase [Kiritimatiellae bacterium]|nr:transposase [Kiritimatiellia bacterium]
MARPWRVRFAGAKYHLTGRGNGRAALFLAPEDYARFMEQLDAALDADGVILYAYALMPNHYHLFVETPMGNVQRFMQRLNTAYGMYFRFKHSRPGHCFQGRYGAKLVAGDRYILGLTRYIHLNPVKVKPLASASLERKRTALREHPWSSYRGYAGLAERESRVDYRWLAIMGCRSDRGNRLAYRGFVEAMLGRDDSEFLEEIGKSRCAIGDDRFREEAEDELKERRLERMVTGDIVRPEDCRPALDVVAEAAAEVLGVALSDVRFHGHRLGDRKALAVEWCCRLSGASQRKVAEYLGYGSEAAVGKARRRAQAALAQDPAFGAAERKLVRRLSACKTQTRQEVSRPKG